MSAAIVVALVLVCALGSAVPSQIIESRLSTIERRLDQIQSRVDSIEREQRMTSINTTRSELSQGTVLELQRRQNGLAQEVIVMQQKMLELTKAIDALKDEKREAERAKSAPAKKP